MHISKLVACLVFVVAVSDVSAQWGNNNIGVVGLEDCMCNTGDYCQLRPDGRYMCQRPSGLFYVPLRRVNGQGIVGQHKSFSGPVRGVQSVIGQGLLVGQGQGLIKNKLNGLIGGNSLGNDNPRDPCFNKVCENGGYCTAPADRPFCVCPVRYSGDSCQHISTCCYSQDYQVCAVQGYTGVSSYTQGGICDKFFFNGQSCQSIDVYTSCVAALNPTNLYTSIQACQAKCSGVSY